MPVLWFILGAASGALLAWLWLRTRLVTAERGNQIEQRFQAAADAAMRSSQTAFLDAARSTLEVVRTEMTGDLAQRQTAIEGVVRPISETIGRLEAQVREMEKSRQTMFGSIGQQLQTLNKETMTLAQAMTSPQGRGRWGELTLRRVAELANMVRDCDFSEQETCDTADRRIRPDMIVRLPGGRVMAVDAKAPLTGYVEASAATGEAARREGLQRHAQQIFEHVKALGSKQYWKDLPSPDFVVLFLPGDHFLSAALERRPDLLETAMQRNVLLATPLTLISVLKGVGFARNQERVAENAEQIRITAMDLAAKLATVAKYYATTGVQLQKTVEVYNQSVGSWDARLTPALRRLADLGIPAEDEKGPQRIDLSVREPKPLRALEDVNERRATAAPY